MAIFNRNKVNQAGMAPEVNEFYKAEGRERTVVAWIMAIGTLILTILVVLGLFYGGRWAVRKIKNRNNTSVAVHTEKVSSTNTSKSESGNSETSQNTGTSGATSSTSANSTSSTSNSSATSAPASSSTTPAANSAQSNANSRLTNTGPGDTFAIFMAVSVLAYFVHRFYLTKSK